MMKLRFGLLLSCLSLYSGACRAQETDVPPLPSQQAPTSLAAPAPRSEFSVQRAHIKRLIRKISNDHPSEVDVKIIAHDRSSTPVRLARELEAMGVPRNRIHIVMEEGAPGRYEVLVRHIPPARDVVDVDVDVDAFSFSVKDLLPYTNQSNESDPRLGSSNRTNLSAMAANPNDLVRGRGEIFADGERAALSVANYRVFKESGK